MRVLSIGSPPTAPPVSEAGGPGCIQPNETNTQLPSRQPPSHAVRGKVEEAGKADLGLCRGSGRALLLEGARRGGRGRRSGAGRGTI